MSKANFLKNRAALITSLTALVICLFISLYLIWQGSGVDRKIKNLKLVIDCSIYDLQGKILKIYNGDQCLFLDDGRIITGHIDSIAMYGKSGEQIWTKKISRHHIMNFAKNKETLVFLSDYVIPYKGKKTLFEKVIEMDLNGNILAEWKMSDHLEEIKAHVGEIPLLKGQYAKTRGAEVNATHANSIYEIPEIAKFPAGHKFQKGNFLLNINRDRWNMLVLSADLKEIKWISTKEIYLHDARFLPNGNILYFRNLIDKESNKTPQSTISEWDPISEEFVWSYPSDPSNYFYSDVRGSVTTLDENTFYFTKFKFTDKGKVEEDGEVVITNRKNENLGSIKIPKNEINRQYLSRIYLQDLSSFFQHSTY